VVFSVEEVSDILMPAHGPGLKCRAALSISHGAGLRAAEVCNRKIGGIDSDRMLVEPCACIGDYDGFMMRHAKEYDHGTFLREGLCEARQDRCG